MRRAENTQPDARVALLRSTFMRWPVALAAVPLLLLAGCTADPAPIDPGPTLAPPPTATTPPLPDTGDDLLFRISATLLDTAGPVEVVLTGRTPQPSDAPGREAVRDAFLAQCAALGDTSLSAPGLVESGSTLMVIDVTASTSLSEPVDLRLGGASARQLASGAVTKTNTGCFSGWQLTGETASAITAYETGTTAPDAAQWMLGGYGFEASVGSAVTFEDCSLELTDLARASGVESVEGWTAADAVGEHGCWFGYAGD